MKKYEEKIQKLRSIQEELLTIKNIMTLQHSNIFMLFNSFGNTISDLEKICEEYEKEIEGIKLSFLAYTINC